jgi:hypothetical protein
MTWGNSMDAVLNKQHNSQPNATVETLYKKDIAAPRSSYLNKAWTAIKNTPSAIWGAITAATYWAWANGIQMTSSYPNGKKDAEHLTAGKIFKQLSGFVTSMIATTLVRLTRLAVYVAAASVIFYAIFALVSTAPISVPVAAGIAALTALTSAAVVSAVLALATKSMWEEPSKAIDRNFYKFINLLIGNVDKDGKLNKYGSGEELDALSKKAHKFGYNAADALANAVSFVFSLPGKAIGMVFGSKADATNNAVFPQESTEPLLVVTENLTVEGTTVEETNEASTNLLPSGGLKRVNSQMSLRDLANMDPEAIVEGFGLVTARSAAKPSLSM